MRTALIQMTSGDDPARNLADVAAMCSEAAGQGADFVLTPEVTNCVSMDRQLQSRVLHRQEDDPTLTGLRSLAKDKSIWLLVGSLALKSGDPDGRLVNRSFLLAPTGEIAAWYDKIHMFDVAVTPEETYRESAGFRPGERAVVAETPFGRVGMSVCYDVRFPHLYRCLAQAGAEILTVPSAFSPVTGAAHWHVLLRARAIETGCYVLAPAQTGHHAAATGRGRRTYGHSLAVDPWGNVLVDGGTEVGIHYLTVDRREIAAARQKIPSIAADAPYVLAK